MKDTVTILGVLLLIGGLFTAVYAFELDPATTIGDDKYKLVCGGEIAVPLLGFKDAEIKSASCSYEKCSVFGSLSLFSEQGDIQLVVNGEVQESNSWKGNLGANQNYALDSECMLKEEFQSASIVLFEDGSGLVDSQEVTIQ